MKLADQGVGSFVPEKDELIGLRKKKLTHEEYFVRKLKVVDKEVGTFKRELSTEEG